MKTIKLTITEDDLKKAKQHMAKGLDVCRGCLVFQAAKRNRLNPVVCDYGSLLCRNGDIYSISDDGFEVTSTAVRFWPMYVGKSFTITKA